MFSAKAALIVAAIIANLGSSCSVMEARSGISRAAPLLCYGPVPEVVAAHQLSDSPASHVDPDPSFRATLDAVAIVDPSEVPSNHRASSGRRRRLQDACRFRWAPAP
jgi:hypothetical protein